MTIKASPLRIELASLAVTGSGRAMYPAFDPGTLHYAVGCAFPGAVVLTLSTKDADTRLAVNRIQQSSNQNVSVELAGLSDDRDIAVTLSNGNGASTTYTVHCLPGDFPGVRTEKQPWASAELITLSATNFAAVVDTNHPLLRSPQRSCSDRSVFPSLPLISKADPWNSGKIELGILGTAMGGRCATST